ncbi:hypothetical protein [Natronococcus roseus]|uniref:hypothetical protein n=1 Tax=Natronococcus roseus TaxID=1052014 RepID=UPI00374D03F0
MSRRAFARYGVLIAGLITGGSGTAAGTPRENAASERSEIEEGVMAPYQVVPESQVTVVEPDIGWRPRGLESHEAYVISYDHAPSLRAVLLTDRPLRADRSLTIGETREAVTETNRSLVAVGLEA